MKVWIVKEVGCGLGDWTDCRVMGVYSSYDAAARAIEGRTIVEVETREDGLEELVAHIPVRLEGRARDGHEWELREAGWWDYMKWTIEDHEVRD